VSGIRDVIDDRVDKGAGATTTSLNLLARARADDPAAWARLVELYGSVVYGWCRRAGLGGEDAADVGQEVFLAVARGLRTFRGDRPGDSFRGWLFTVTRNKVRDFVGRRGVVAPGGTGHARLAAEPALEPDDASSWDDRRRLVRRAVDLVRGEFEVRTWEAFWRTAVDGRSPEAVAEELGMTRAAVYLARSRVRRRLVAEFGELIEFGPEGGGGES
jgi:RNA polymerase sigma-70 factor (ECF subfamily)